MSMNRVIFQRRQAKVKKKYRLRQGFHGRNGPGALIRRLFASFIFAIVAVDSLLSDQNHFLLLSDFWCPAGALNYALVPSP